MYIGERMAVALYKNLLDGRPPSIGLISATYIAQSAATDKGLDSRKLHEVQLKILNAIQAWLKLNYPNKFVDRKKWEIGFAVDSNYWGEIIFGIDDVMDALVHLRFLSESNWKALTDEVELPTIFLALLFLALEHASKLIDENESSLVMSYSLMAHKCVTEFQLITYIFSDSDEHKNDIEKAAKAAISNNARKGGLKKNKPAIALKEKAIEFYNDGDYKNPRQGARAIVQMVQKYGRAELGFYLTTDEPWSKIYKWLLDARKNGELRE